MVGKNELSCQARGPGSTPNFVAYFLGLSCLFLGCEVALEKPDHGGGHRRKVPLVMDKTVERGVVFGKKKKLYS